MFDNVVRLIGFVGSDAELKPRKRNMNTPCCPWRQRRLGRDKNGDGYIRRTEWHKLVAWGIFPLLLRP